MEVDPDIPRVGAVGWAIIGSFVVAWDMLAEESLSGAFHRGLENKYTRPVVLGALAITGAHLCDILPHEPVECDPFHWLARLRNK